jgi:hypothetical protein
MQEGMARNENEIKKKGASAASFLSQNNNFVCKMFTYLTVLST